MSTTEEQHYDDLAIDYSLGQVLEGFSILDTRGELPNWVIPHVEMVATTLSTSASLPAHVGQSVALTTQEQSFTPEQIVAGLRHVAANGVADPTCNLRSMHNYLAAWRKQLRALRPPPRFSQRPR